MMLLNLPQEIVSNIITFLEPVHIVRLGRTCQQAHALISPSNQILWREAFLQIFDDPEHAWSKYPLSYETSREEWDWHLELKRRHLALRSLHRRDPDSNDDQSPEDHIRALLSIIDTAKYALSPAEIAQGRVPKVDDRSSLNLQLLQNAHKYYREMDRLVHEDSARRNVPGALEDFPDLPGRVMTRSRVQAARQGSRCDAVSRLHVLHGLTNRERIDSKTRGQARRKTYDWNLTSDATDYGPFLADGSGQVNWYLLEGAFSTIYRNFEMCVDGHIALPNGICYSIPHRTLANAANPRDWARVEGSWLGTYAFLDYADLLAFNGGAIGGSRRPNLDNELEACGDLLKMELKLDDSVKDDCKLKTKLPADSDPNYPPLYFRGVSRGQSFTGNPITTIKGFAALVPGGREVRWKFIVAYHGSDQWQLEGVQPGGIRSGGIFGLWSQVGHVPAGSIGPFCYYPMELTKPTSIVLVG